MKTVFTNNDADTIVANVERPAMDSKVAELSGELKSNVSERPHILLRRSARWARRASHV